MRLRWNFAQSVDEFLGRDWLLEESRHVRPLDDGGSGGVVRVAGSGDDKRDQPRFAECLQLVEQLDPSVFRKHQIEDHDVGLGITHFLDRHESVGRREDAKSRFPDDVLEILEHLGIVLDDQDCAADSARRVRGWHGDDYSGWIKKRKAPIAGGLLAILMQSLEMQALLAYTVGMIKKHCVQYTIRDIPATVNDALQQKARRSGKSLNSIARDALTKEAGLEGQARLHHDLDSFFGSWIEDPAVDKALADQRKIDKNLWR